MARPRVLIIAPQGDSHVPFVLPHLARLGAEVFQLELAQLPRQARIAAHLGRAHPSWTCQLEANQQRVALEELTSIWNRRRGALHRPAYRPDPLFPPGIQTFVQAETRAGMEGIWKSLPVLHVNAPEATTVAEYKPYQLQVALACGLTIPDTCLTNDPATARQFLDAHDGRVVYKTLSRALIPQAGQPWWLYTSQREARHRAELERVRPMLHLFQQRIEKRLELRVTIIGEAIFAAEIYSQHAERTRLDWRRSYEDLRYGIHRLPAEMERRLLRFMRRLGLEFAALDLIVQPDGQYIFLECNACGQFYWIEAETGLPLCATLAAFLVAGQASPAEHAAGPQEISESGLL
jgi:hypothetical protein